MCVMKALGRPVCQFADDQTDMAWRYGLDSQRGEHGFPVFDSSEKVAEWINGLDSEAVSIGDIGLGWRQTLEDFKKGKNRRLGRTVVYMPAFTCRDRIPGAVCFLFRKMPSVMLWRRGSGNMAISDIWSSYRVSL